MATEGKGQLVRVAILAVGLSSRDLPMLRASLQRHDTFTLRVAPSASVALTLASRQATDVVLYDLTAESTGGVGFVGDLIRKGYRGAVIVLGDASDKQSAAAALSAGAHEYVPKDGQAWSTLPSLLVRAARFGRLARRLAELEGALENARDRVEQEGRIDPLSGLFRGKYLAELYERDLRRLKRYGGHMAILDANIYNLKSLRESGEASAADEVVKGFAAIVQRSLRTTDFAGYRGEGHFSLLLPFTDSTGVRTVVARLERAVAESNERAPNRPEAKVSFSLRAAGGYDELTKRRQE